MLGIIPVNYWNVLNTFVLYGLLVGAGVLLFKWFWMDNFEFRFLKGTRESSRPILAGRDRTRPQRARSGGARSAGLPQAADAHPARDRLRLLDAAHGLRR